MGAAALSIDRCIGAGSACDGFTLEVGSSVVTEEVLACAHSEEPAGESVPLEQMLMWCLPPHLWHFVGLWHSRLI